MPKKKNKIHMHVKQGDIVQIISGDHKGEIGEIKQIIRNRSQLIIQNINLKTKHVRPTKENETGKIIQIESPIHSSNVMLYSKKKGVCSRYYKQINTNKIKTRILKKTGEII